MVRGRKRAFVVRMLSENTQILSRYLYKDEQMMLIGLIASIPHCLASSFMAGCTATTVCGVLWADPPRFKIPISSRDLKQQSPDQDSSEQNPSRIYADMTCRLPLKPLAMKESRRSFAENVGSETMRCPANRSWHTQL